MTTTKIFPTVYVGTYAKYNSGSILGEWLYLGDYDKESFYEKCKEIHKDEENPELMYQDWDNDPGNYISESGIKDELWDFMDYASDWDSKKMEAFNCFVSYYGESDPQLFEDKYQGQWDSEEDFAEEIINSCYDLKKMMGNLHYYFDFELYAKDLFIDDYYMSRSGHVFSRY